MARSTAQNRLTAVGRDAFISSAALAVSSPARWASEPQRLLKHRWLERPHHHLLYCVYHVPVRPAFEVFKGIREFSLIYKYKLSRPSIQGSSPLLTQGLQFISSGLLLSCQGVCPRPFCRVFHRHLHGTVCRPGRRVLSSQPLP